ncbi:unnamed protein product [Paramecium primaurelia]|uniref:Uncharacterized protein n=1 Tax=Paramecium primaurelia TaxID=5886 RepID=A0A8S1K6V0_PARPR|nr:unnamed protein product [Paramecium primaurelia]
MGCTLRKQKQFSTININEQNTFYFVIINGDQGLKNFKKRNRLSNSVPILGSINHSTIISRRIKLFPSQFGQMVLKINNLKTSIQEQHNG